MIRPFDREDFDSVYSIMEKSFPRDEHRPCEEQKALLDNERYNIRVATDDGKVVAFIAYWKLEDLLYIEHFATDPECRGRGIGAMILSDICRENNGTVCLEVEPPESEITRRRIGFYERNGFHLNEYPYIQPPISKGCEPVPLMIMTYKNKIDRSEFENIRDLLYKEVYKTDKKAWLS